LVEEVPEPRVVLEVNYNGLIEVSADVLSEE
jgi:hypothetical protein